MNYNCDFYTPDIYVNYMLDVIGYTSNLYNKTVLENSCGAGNILKEVVKRYIEISIKEGYSLYEIKKGLEKNIVGYDINKNRLNECISKLNKIAKKYKLYDINWNIHAKDYLKSKQNFYDFILSNPPYITYHNLNVNTRNYLKNNFKSCKTGRFDYCYAFLEKGINNLTNNGKMIYLVPYSVLRNKYAHNLRQLLKPKIRSIVDFTGIRVFSNATTSNILLFLKNTDSKKIKYINRLNNYNLDIKKDTLGDKWIFNKANTGNFRFGDYFKVSNSVATLCNNVFIFQENKSNKQFFYINNFPVEKELIYNASSAKSEKKFLQTGLRDKIIFPYKISSSGSINKFTEEEFKYLFPNCYIYFSANKEKLNSRKAEKSAKWFEYGRSQAINNLSNKKLILSLVITNSVKTYIVGNDYIPYAGAYIKALPNKKLDLEKAKEILESEDFFKYIQNCGTPTTATSYRITVKDIENYLFNL